VNGADRHTHTDRQTEREIEGERGSRRNIRYVVETDGEDTKQEDK